MPDTFNMSRFYSALQLAVNSIDKEIPIRLHIKANIKGVDTFVYHYITSERYIEKKKNNNDDIEEKTSWYFKITDDRNVKKLSAQELLKIINKEMSYEPRFTLDNLFFTLDIIEFSYKGRELKTPTLCFELKEMMETQNGTLECLAEIVKIYSDIDYGDYGEEG